MTNPDIPTPETNPSIWHFSYDDGEGDREGEFVAKCDYADLERRLHVANERIGRMVAKADEIAESVRKLTRVVGSVSFNAHDTIAFANEIKEAGE